MKGTNDCQIGQKSIHQKSNSQEKQKTIPEAYNQYL